MKRIALLAGCLALLASCDTPSVTADPKAESMMENGQVALVAQAPDGTKLWGVTPPGTYRRVYFSSTGTQKHHSENCGKSCTRVVDDIVPSAN